MKKAFICFLLSTSTIIIGSDQSDCKYNNKENVDSIFLELCAEKIEDSENHIKESKNRNEKSYWEGSRDAFVNIYYCYGYLVSKYK